MDIVKSFFSEWFSVSQGLINFPSVQYIIMFSILYTFYTIFYKNDIVRVALLLGFSLYIYYRLSGFGILILLLLSASDFIIAKQIAGAVEQHRKNILLACSIILNLATLGYFKYSNFFLSQYQSIVSPGNIFVPMMIAAPIGISYYVFKSLGYVIDTHRGIIEEPERKFTIYLLYTSFFPTIIAGPISRSRELLPQFHRKPVLTNYDTSRAFILIMSGVFKKIVIADFIAVNFLDRVLDTPNYFSGLECFFALIAAPIQVYYDFSGYTDIALGIALLLGFEIKNNFNLPFHAKTVTEFWRRWHITLLDWFNEYIFTPLNFRLRTWRKSAAVIAIMVTFLLSGIWHGAAWTFIMWGLLHGTMIVIEHLTVRWRSSGKNVIIKERSWAVIAFIFIAASFILFKSNSIGSALSLLGKIPDGFSPDLMMQWMDIYYGVFIAIVAGYVLHFLPEQYEITIGRKFSKLSRLKQAVLIAIAGYAIYQVGSADTKPFIYLKF